jgi:hypothetical protein
MAQGRAAGFDHAFFGAIKLEGIFGLYLGLVEISGLPA